MKHPLTGAVEIVAVGKSKQEHGVCLLEVKEVKEVKEVEEVEEVKEVKEVEEVKTDAFLGDLFVEATDAKGHHAPHQKGVFFGHFYGLVVSIGGHQPSTTFVLVDLEAL